MPQVINTEKRSAWRALMAIVSLTLGCSRELPLPSVSIQNTLQNPVRVLRTLGDTIVLSNGSERVVPGIGRCVAVSPEIRSILEQGLELSSASTDVHCLVSIFHKCGNDPISEQVERVNLEDLIAVITAAADSGEIPGIRAAFNNGDLTYALFYDLLRSYGLHWDEKSDVEFP